MKTMRLRERTGEDGVLHLHVPVGLAGADCEVVVVVQPEAAESRGWLPGFFETLAKGWQGEPLVRPPQGEYERREPLS
jgi:hypothetical protein